MKGFIEKTIKVYNKLITAALGERKQHVHEMSIYIKQTEIGNYNLIKGYLFGFTDPNYVLLYFCYL